MQTKSLHEYKKQIEQADQAGLAYAGHKNGEPQFIGTKSEWKEYDEVSCLDCMDTGEIGDVDPVTCHCQLEVGEADQDL